MKPLNMTKTDQNSLYTSKSRSYYKAVKRGVLACLQEEPSFGRILDIGGGDGATSAHLISHGRATSALIVDPFSEAEDDGSLTFSHDSADDLGVFKNMEAAGSQFDTVLCLDVLEHLINPWETLVEIQKLQPPDSLLVVCMPNARFVALTVPLVFKGRFDYKPSGIMDKTHIRWFTRSTTIELIEQAGYEITKIDAIIEPRVKWINRLTLGLFKGFFEYQYVMQARPRLP